MHRFENHKFMDYQFFGEMYKKYYVRLCRFAYYYLNSKELAEETVQDFFTVLWDRRSKIIIDDNIESYFFVSIRNAAFSRIRKARNINNINVQIDAAIVDSQNDFNEEIFKKRLEGAIKKLPEKCRIIYCLKYIEGLTYSEISDYLNISEKTIETQIYRALLKLRKELNPFRFEFYSTEKS